VKQEQQARGGALEGWSGQQQEPHFFDLTTEKINASSLDADGGKIISSLERRASQCASFFNSLFTLLLPVSAAAAIIRVTIHSPMRLVKAGGPRN